MTTNDGRCVAPGCDKPRAPMSRRCTQHQSRFKRYGSDYGPGIKVSLLLKNYDESARQRIEQLADGGEKAQAMLAWAEQMLRSVLTNQTGRLRSIVKPWREAAEWMQRLPDDDGLRRRLLARLLAIEWAVHGNRPAWRDRDAEAINRGRLFVSGHGYVAPKGKKVLRAIGEELMDSRLTEWCQKIVRHDEARQEATRLAADAAFKALEET